MEYKNLKIQFKVSQKSKLIRMLLACQRVFVMRCNISNYSFFATKTKVRQTKPTFYMIIFFSFKTLLCTRRAFNQVFTLLRNYLYYPLHS